VDDFRWQFTLLGKYTSGRRNAKPFVEFGPSFLPLENRDQTGITTGAGAEIRLRRVNLAPTLRYTRWITNDSLGGVRDQFQFLVRVHETSTSEKPTALGRPLSLGFVAGFGVTKLLRSRTEPVFMSATDSDGHAPIAGIMVEIPLHKHLSLEVDGLYRPTHTISGLILPDGNIQYGSRSAFLTWEVPTLAKYKIPVSRVNPVIELGPSFRAIAHANSEDYSHIGVSGGIGVSSHFARLNVAPVIRYTRWAADKKRFGREPLPGTRLNQLELIVGFSF
jgi:hypothetical protein